MARQSEFVFADDNDPVLVGEPSSGLSELGQPSRFEPVTVANTSSGFELSYPGSNDSGLIVAPGGAFSSDLFLVQVNQPTLLEQVGSLTVNGDIGPMSPVLSSNYAFFNVEDSNSNNLVYSVDISDPTSPFVADTVTLPGGIDDMTIETDSSGNAEAIYVVDLNASEILSVTATDPTSLVYSDNLSLSSIEDNLTYVPGTDDVAVSQEPNGIVRVDVSDPTSMSEMSRASTLGPNNTANDIATAVDSIVVQSLQQGVVEYFKLNSSSIDTNYVNDHSIFHNFGLATDGYTFVVRGTDNTIMPGSINSNADRVYVSVPISTPLDDGFGITITQGAVYSPQGVFGTEDVMVYR